MKLSYKISSVFWLLTAVIILSCGSSETKPASQNPGIDTLQYEDTMVTKDPALLPDSVLPAGTTINIDDTAALALKAKLAADTVSTKISDSVRRDIRKAKEYMNRKQKR